MWKSLLRVTLKVLTHNHANSLLVQNILQKNVLLAMRSLRLKISAHPSEQMQYFGKICCFYPQKTSRSKAQLSLIHNLQELKTHEILIK